MYAHEKNNSLRQYLKRKADCSLNPYGNTEGSLEQLIDTVDVFNVDKMQDAIENFDRKSNLHRNYQRFLAFLDGTAGFLQLAVVPNNINEKLNELLLKFPNFIEVIEFYREQLALAQIADSSHFVANPLLITGQPGIGKTAFCHDLANIMTAHFELISLSGMTAGFVLGGMSSSWAEGKPGRIVEALARGCCANPLIVVDEIDKSGGDKRYDPLGSLYQLLEKETSVNFIDEGLEIPTDCSHIVWVATANELELISEPIISRFTVIEVKRPTPQQMENVLRSIYQKIRKDHAWGAQFNADLSPTVMDKAINSGLPPRLIQRELISACGKTVLRQPKSLENAQYSISVDDFKPRELPKRQLKIGFV